MRWSIIRLIWLRELRDQLRDRRTLFMIAVLPLMLYPVLGFAVLQFALGLIDRPSVIGIEYGPLHSIDFPELPPPAAPDHDELVRRHLAWFSLTFADGFPENVVGAAALASAQDWISYCPPLLRVHENKAILLAGSNLADLQIPLKEGKIPRELVALVHVKFEMLDA